MYFINTSWSQIRSVLEARQRTSTKPFQRRSHKSRRSHPANTTSFPHLASIAHKTDLTSPASLTDSPKHGWLTRADVTPRVEMTQQSNSTNETHYGWETELCPRVPLRREETGFNIRLSQSYTNAASSAEVKGDPAFWITSLLLIKHYRLLIKTRLCSKE